MGKAKPPARSQSDLRAFAESVLASAVDVLVNGLSVFIEEPRRFEELNAKKRSRTLTDQTELGEWVKFQSVLIAHFLTCRQLDEFLTGSPPGKHSDDAFAALFVSDEKAWRATVRKAMPVSKDFREAVNKNLFHLTFSNKLMTAPSIEFSGDYTVFVLRGLEAFLKAADAGSIEEEFRVRLLRDISSTRATYEAIIALNMTADLVHGRPIRR